MDHTHILVRTVLILFPKYFINQTVHQKEKLNTYIQFYAEFTCTLKERRSK